MAPPLSPKDITAVALPWMPILCSMEAQIRSLRSPRLPSALMRNFGAMNREMPFTPGGASGRRASTRWTMFSAMSCSPQVMKILVPVMAYAFAEAGAVHRARQAWQSHRGLVRPGGAPADAEARLRQALLAAFSDRLARRGE